MPNELFRISHVKNLHVNLKRLGKEFAQSGKFIRPEMRKVMFESANEIRNDIIQSLRNTQKDLTKVYARGRKTHNPSLAGHPPAIDTGDMLKNVNYDAEDYKFEIGSTLNDPPYPAWLEEPPPKAPYEERPWLMPAVNRNESGIYSRIGKVIPDLTDKIFRRAR